VRGESKSNIFTYFTQYVFNVNVIKQSYIETVNRPGASILFFSSKLFVYEYYVRKRYYYLILKFTPFKH